VLIEPGSGASRKVELLLDALRPSAYVAVDISAEQVCSAGRRLAAAYPWLHCYTVAADYNQPFSLPAQLPEQRRVAFYPGSTLGNFEPAAAVAFLQRLWTLVKPGGGLLIGIDLRKEVALLERAYNDRLGVTAEFNKNALRHLNRLAGADFNLGEYQHVAFYDTDLHRIEMHLQSRRAQRVAIDGVDIDIAAGERIHTENSYKYTTESFAALAQRAGFERVQTWYDRELLFSVHYLVAATPTRAAGH
jgi:dimethylhistidine N-methyltransferase